MSILLKSVELEGRETDIYIEGDRIAHIIPSVSCSGVEKPDGRHENPVPGVPAGQSGLRADTPHKADTVIDGRRKAVIPGLINMHTHAAMTLFRGYGDDMPLMPWLEEKIWPNEAKLTDEDVYWGAKLACVEMLHSGTTTFFDMYHKPDATAQAVEEMGLRAILSEACFDHFRPELAERSKQNIRRRFATPSAYGSRIRHALGPHAIYTVSGELLQWSCDFAKENDLPVHLHLAETMGETEQSLTRFGTTPVRYLHQLGVLSPNLVLAHVLYVDEEEIAMLADNGVKVVHNPASNMKLASGYRFRYQEMKKAGITVTLGTDGCSSSNNLDMIETMKLASLLGKVWREDPQALPCDEMLYAATRAGADATGLKTGQVAEGYLADLCLIDLNLPVFTPNFNFVSNLVFAANGSSVDTVICNGQVVMRGRKVAGEELIMEQTARTAYNLMKRSHS